MIVVQPENGLANRLRVIASFLALARPADRPFEVSWAPSAGWSEEDFADLFVHDLARTTPDSFASLASEGSRFDEMVELHREPLESQTWLGDLRFQDLFDHERYPVITYRGCQPVGRLVPPGELDRFFPSYRAEYLAGSARRGRTQLPLLRRAPIQPRLRHNGSGSVTPPGSTRGTGWS